MTTDAAVLFGLVTTLGGALLQKLYASLTATEAFLLWVSLIALSSFGLMVFVEYFSKRGKERRKQRKFIEEIPQVISSELEPGVQMGIESDLGIPIYLPDSIRRRHVHILGATGSGKTESVILNFLRQDVDRALGAIILDAKGDASFLSSLKEWVPSEKLRVFDLSSVTSLTYNPIYSGTPLEAAQRLFSSLVWSEEYYKSKALAALQKLFEAHHAKNKHNPTIHELHGYLEHFSGYLAAIGIPSEGKKFAEKDFIELSGLRDQLRTLCMGHLKPILSPEGTGEMHLKDVSNGCVLYFRLQSLLSPQLVSTLGKLLIQHLNFLAGTAHREEKAIDERLIPTYLDEFATFACPEFADLVSKARSAGFALHFSHQSVGDLAEVSEGFLNRITDNSATKIIMRINDPDSADFFARSFGTKLYQKTTQRITNAKDIDSAEVLEEGTQREAHQFRAAPDLFKTLPTGVGSVLIAHGYDTPHGASTVFKIKFPKLEKKEERNEN